METNTRINSSKSFSKLSWGQALCNLQIIYYLYTLKHSNKVILLLSYFSDKDTKAQEYRYNLPKLLQLVSSRADFQTQTSGSKVLCKDDDDDDDDDHNNCKTLNVFLFQIQTFFKITLSPTQNKQGGSGHGSLGQLQWGLSSLRCWEGSLACCVVVERESSSLKNSSHSSWKRRITRACCTRAIYKRLRHQSRAKNPDLTLTQTLFKSPGHVSTEIPGVCL